MCEFEGVSAVFCECPHGGGFGDACGVGCVFKPGAAVFFRDRALVVVYVGEVAVDVAGVIDKYGVAMFEAARDA